MKILILANSSSGLYSFRNELVLRLLQKFEVAISIPDDICRKELEDEGCVVIHTPINRRGMNPIEDFKLFRAYQKLLKIEKPDLVLTYTIKPNIYGGMACKLAKIPYMATITGLGSAFQKKGVLKKIIIKMYRDALEKAECVFFQNEENKRIFADCHIQAKKQKLVKGSGVNLLAHPYEEYPDGRVNRFLFIGRIMHEKGIDEFLEAAKFFHDENNIFEILGYCEDEYKGKLQEYEQLGYVVHYGYQKNVNKYLSDCSALILPTFYPEGMSNVLMEASATGRPVFGTNIPGSKDIIEDGITGFIFEPQNANSLIEAIQKFLKLSLSERAQMGYAARAKMEREFDREKVVDDYIQEIYSSLGE